VPFITQGKANIKYLLIVILVVAIFGGFIFFTWNNYQKELVNSNEVIEKESVINTSKVVEKEPVINTSETNKIEEKVTSQMSDEEAREFFQATEIVSNKLPDSIEFWTQAYCPGSGTDYDYNFDHIDVFEYSFDSCVQGGKRLTWRM